MLNVAVTAMVAVARITIPYFVMSLIDIQFGSLVATACKGPFSGNDTGAGDPLQTKLNDDLFDSVDPDASWSLLGKSDDTNPTFITATDTAEGTLTLGGDLSFWLGKTFVISLKAANSYSAYLFQNFQGNTLQAAYNTIGVSQNGQGNAQGLSHASIFIANLPQTPPPRLPEPASLLGLGLIATGILTVRRQRSI
jgi:hypothetical protein